MHMIIILATRHANILVQKKLMRVHKRCMHTKLHTLHEETISVLAVLGLFY